MLPTPPLAIARSGLLPALREPFGISDVPEQRKEEEKKEKALRVPGMKIVPLRVAEQGYGITLEGWSHEDPTSNVDPSSRASRWTPTHSLSPAVGRIRLLLAGDWIC